MNSSVIPPFPEPTNIATPSVDLITNDQVYIQDSVAYAGYKSILPRKSNH